MDRSKIIFSENGFSVEKPVSLKNGTLNRKRAKTIVIFGISTFDYLLSTEFQLKSEETVGGLPSLDMIRQFFVSQEGLGMGVTVAVLCSDIYTLKKSFVEIL